VSKSCAVKFRPSNPPIRRSDAAGRSPTIPNSMPPQKTVPRTEDAKRQARIAELRAAIAAGTYETREKLSAALEAFLSSPDSEPRPARSKPSPRPPR
jgi:anti-sigma28 factor (negative regulator of flagellin synthesis)